MSSTYAPGRLNSTIYYPYQMTTVVGTLEAGTTVADLAVRGSGLHWDEVSGSPGWDIIFDWRNVPPFPQNLYIASWYNGNHFPNLEIWDYVAGAWVDVHTYNDFGAAGATNWLSTVVPLEAQHYSAGAVRARLYHAQSGSTSHDIYVDVVGVR